MGDTLGQHTLTGARAGQEEGKLSAGSLGGLILSRVCKARQGWFKSHLAHTVEQPVLLPVGLIIWLEQMSLLPVFQEWTLSPISLHLQNTRPSFKVHQDSNPSLTKHLPLFLL